MVTGIRDLRNNLSRYLRRVEAGERVAVTAHGRVVAQIVPVSPRAAARRSRYDELVASGVIQPPVEEGNPLEDWPDVFLAPGTAAALIDEDRAED